MTEVSNIIEHLYIVSGWLGSMLLALCAIPQVILTLRTKNVSALSLPMMYMWLFGCIFALIFGLHSSVPIQVICSYVVNIVSASVAVVCIYLWRQP